MSSNGVEELSRESTEQMINEKANEEERQYLRLIEKIIETGTKRSNRTGIDTYSIFGTQMRFDLRNGKCIIVSPSMYYLIK